MKKRILGASFLATGLVLVAGSCAHNQKVASNGSGKTGRSPSSVSNVGTAQSPALNEEYPDLSKGLDANGNPVAEVELFQHLGEKINQIQEKLKKDHKADVLKRGFHAKAMGCLKGKMRVLDERPAASKFGIFAEDKQEYDVWVRFSNGVGFVQSDHGADVRGMAVKVMGITDEKYGPKLLDDEKQTQDFLMTNSSLPFGKNVEEFMEFAGANATGKLEVLEFASTRPYIVRLLTELATHHTVSPLTERYWSESPYHIGPADGGASAIKYSVFPCSSNGDNTDPNNPPSTSVIGKAWDSIGKGGDSLKEEFDPNYLTARLKEHARVRDACFTFAVQFQKDPKKQPVEDTSIDWEEKDTPFLPVAEIILPPQSFDSPEQTQFCDNLSFNPWHAVAEHRPIGNIGRGRKIVYQYSAHKRNRTQVIEPTPDYVP